jgi:NAD(P)-dependent dehydrogenase (short-subunit alcohol dehydrogenase family)
VNHLAPFLLTHLLLPAIPATGRIVTTSSGAHRQGPMDFEQLRSVADYSAMSAYSRSKLANVLFTRELARRSDRTANCFHPGFVPGSAFFDSLPAPLRIPTKAASLVPGVGTTVESGAARGLYVGVAPETADVTCEDFGRFETQRPSGAACDDETAQRLWRVSEEIVDIGDSEQLQSTQTA